jgi:hypothetical protein
MMNIGDMTKNLLFGPGAKNEEEAIQQIKAALECMPKEHALITGMFISGLLRCNLSQEIQRQYTEEMGETESKTKDEANELTEKQG